MPVKLVLGLQHGDEGKGRVVDDLVESWADVVVRFQGGGNAGHTVYDREGNKFVTHILPVGILQNKNRYRNIVNIIARGCVLNIKDLYEEIKQLESNTSFHDEIRPQDLQISGFCPLIDPTHILRDRQLYQGKLGTTARGIGPAYSDFYARDSILLRDAVANPNDALDKIISKFVNMNLDIKTEQMWWIEGFKEAIAHISQFVMKDESIISDLYNKGANILLEGAQGCGLNIHSNNYPDVTSSAPTVGGALNSTGLNHKQIDEVIGVIKTYKTKVGTGNFPSRCNEKDEEVLSKFGNEFGATTGRPRKCGWLDLDEVNHAVKMNGVDHICLIKADVFCNIENPFVYYKNKLIQIPKINDVSLDDKAFVELLNVIKDKTDVNVMSFTTGPKRGEIVWHESI
jgi:adenylosuccinate synthase